MLTAVLDVPLEKDPKKECIEPVPLLALLATTVNGVFIEVVPIDIPSFPIRARSVLLVRNIRGVLVNVPSAVSDCCPPK